jgi:hypothetical protein
VTIRAGVTEWPKSTDTHVAHQGQLNQVVAAMLVPPPYHGQDQNGG